jgi:hypothetical protein
MVMALIIFYGLAGLAFSTIQMSLEKDWVVQLSDGDTEWLASANSIMSQIDLGNQAIAPAITGVIFSMFSGTFVAELLLSSNAASTLILFWFLNSLYTDVPSLKRR